jgi:hypothetical protein
MTVPCLLIGLVGIWLSNRPPDSQVTAVVAVPAPPIITPPPFSVQVKSFGLEPVNAHNKALGADTCVTVNAAIVSAPPKFLRWFYARRLVAIKNGKSRVLWHELTPRISPDLQVAYQSSDISNFAFNDNFLFKLSTVPKSSGELVFLWDVFVQPVNKPVASGDDKLVTVDQLNRIAKQARGLRLSRRLVVRSAPKSLPSP